MTDTTTVLRVIDCKFTTLKILLSKYSLILNLVPDDTPISGSYWGDSEAGLISNNIYVRNDTPIHSLLHETCHYICMDNQRRSKIDTNAEGDYDEENGVCYLQILLSAYISEMGIDRMLQDMDAWGYTFRLGSAKVWFTQDAGDALFWLKTHKLLNKSNEPNFCLRD